MIARAAAAPSSSEAGAPALRALRRFFIFAQLAGHTFLLERRFAVQRCSVAVAAVCNSFEPLATSATEECVGRVDSRRASEFFRVPRAGVVLQRSARG